MKHEPISIELKRLGNFSPLRYPGGKAMLAPFLDRLIKIKRLHGSVYVEPYGGGAGAALSLLFLEKVDRIIINDLDPAVYAFWMTATEHTDWLNEQIQTIPLTVEEWRKQRAIYANQAGRDTKELGFALFYLNRTGRSGIVSGWPIGGLDQSGVWKIDARFNRIELKQRIQRIGRYSKRIEIRKEDGVNLAKDFLGRAEGLVYLDPPYFTKGKSLYLNHFNLESHKALAKCLNSFPKSSWLLTYDNVPEIRSLYPKRRIIEFSFTYSAHEHKMGSEILVPSDALSASIA